MEPLLGQFVKDCVPPTLHQAVTWLTLETLQADSPLFPTEMASLPHSLLSQVSAQEACICGLL